MGPNPIRSTKYCIIVVVQSHLSKVGQNDLSDVRLKEVLARGLFVYNKNMKIVCLSFDDGTIYDQRFIELLNKYQLKATLNLNSGLNNFVWYFDDRPVRRLDLSKNSDLYKGHEVASHSLTHPYFSSLNKEQIIKEIKEDIDNLSSIFNERITGFAFPFHDQTEDNIQTVKDAFDLDYIRYSYFSNEYLPKDRYHIPINALYNDEDIYERLEAFEKNNEDNSLFVIAGHSYEFEMKDEWKKIEKLLSYLKDNENITVLTMKEAVKVIFGNK